MSEHDNLEIVKNIYAAARQRNLPALLSRLANDTNSFQIETLDIASTTGTRDSDQIEQYLVTLVERGVADFEPQEFFAQGNKVVVLGDFPKYVSSTASLINPPRIHVFTLDEGKVTEFKSFHGTRAAIGAAECSTANTEAPVSFQPLRRSFL